MYYSLARDNTVNILLKHFFSDSSYRLKDTLKGFKDFKNKQKSVWSNVFSYVKVYIYWMCIQYTVHWDKTHTLSFSFVCSNSSLFYFNSWFLYERKHKACLSKSMCGIFYFQFCFIFVKVYIFQQKAWTLWL